MLRHRLGLSPLSRVGLLCVGLSLLTACGDNLLDEQLGYVKDAVIDLDALKKAGVVPAQAERARILLSGEIKIPVTVKGVGVTKGARAAIEAAGGKVETA